jgi:glutamine synthetase type III
MDEHRDIAPLVLGLANTASMNLPEEQALDVAWVIKTWAILNGITWFHEWPQPIATYSEREIIELIRAEQAAGKLVPVLPDED